MNPKLLALGLFVALGATAPARAQSVHLSYGQSTGRGALSVSLALPLGGARRPSTVWVPGHFEQVQHRVWVEGTERREWVPPVYETHFDECGRPRSVLARQGYWRTFRAAGQFELRVVKVWVDGYWKAAPTVCAPAPSVHYGRRDERRYASHRGRFDGYRHDGRRR